VKKEVSKFTFQFTQSLQSIGQWFEFSKIDFKTEFEKKYLNGHKTIYFFEAGYAIEWH
jgi:hypothetical protein